jgi:serine/threonine-protein kinase 24/25/MST4
MGEIDEWDARAPVSMLDGVSREGDVGGFLEGFLEEVLVRVEAVEEG